MQIIVLQWDAKEKEILPTFSDITALYKILWPLHNTLHERVHASFFPETEIVTEKIKSVYSLLTVKCHIPTPTSFGHICTF